MQRMVLVAAAAVACGGDPTRTESIVELTADVANGEALYGTNCALCHGAAGEGVEGVGSALAGASLALEDVVATVLNGNDLGMTPFGSVLTDQEVVDVSEFALTL